MLESMRRSVTKCCGAALCLVLGVTLAVAAGDGQVIQVAVVDTAGQPVSVATLSAVAQLDGAAKAVPAAPETIYVSDATWVVKNVSQRVELLAGLPGAEVSTGVLKLPADQVVWVLVYLDGDSAEALIVSEKEWAARPAKPESLATGVMAPDGAARPPVQPANSTADAGQSVGEATNKLTCGVGEASILIEVTTDSYGSETSWELAEQISGTVVASGGGYASSTYYSTEYCSDPSLCYVFTIDDSWGDGIFSPGGYIVSYESGEVANTMGGLFGGPQDTVNVGGGCTSCTVTCPGGAGAEGETCGGDTNGGCNMVTPAFEPIACDDTICGTIWADASSRDTDWYEVTVATDTEFTFAVEADFPVVIGLAPTDPAGSGNCADLGAGLDPFAVGDPCQPISVTICLPAGTHWFFVSHQDYTGDPCGTTNDYVATLTCVSCSIPSGACCDIAGTCTPDQTVDQCDALGGAWEGDGTVCTPNPCTPQYCESTATSTADSRCDQVILNTINNDSTADGCSTYTDFTAISTDLNRGATYALDVIAGTCGGCYGKWGKVFIDWNQDYDFDDAGEQVYTSGSSSSGCPYTFSGFITVPIGAALGNTTMRVVVREGGSESSTQACGTYTWGETEDYTVNIQEAPPEGACCTGVTCSILSAGDCGTAGGVYKGDGSTCSPNPCSGACCQYPSGSCSDGSAADCTTAGGTYQGDTTNCATTTCPTPGDTCGAPMAVTLGLGDLPYADANTNCGRGDNYDDPSTAHCLYYYDSGEDMIYELTVTEAMDVNIRMEPNGTTWSGIAIGDACPPTDSCLGSDYHSSSDPLLIECVHLEPGTYYIQVDTWSSPDCIPAFDLTIEQCIACDVTCTGTAEGEPVCSDDYDDVTNGGCNSTVPVYGSIGIGETVCGTGGTFLSGIDDSRDTDWYEITTTDWMELTWTVEAEFDVSSFIVDGGAGCDTPVILESDVAGDCEPLALTTECLRPGTYWFLAMTSDFTGVPCGAEYSGTLTGSVCPPTYCTTSWSNCPGPDDWITNVTVNTINNTTGDECATGSYGDYTAISTSLPGASTHTLSVSFLSAGYTQCVKAWIDWNQDWVFDPGEEYDLGSGVDTTLTTDITVPLSALLGATTMRVSERYSSCPGPCDHATYGETEDYTIIVTEPIGACCAGTTCSITTEAACGGTWLGAGTVCGDDCDGNGIADACDINAGAPDCQGDGILDECQLFDNDCNSDSIPDDCQLTNNDCNSDSVPDDCQLVGNDCQPDGIPDDCQLSVAPAPGGKDVVINEGFEGTVPPTDWSAIVNNAYTWKATVGTPPEGVQFADCEYDPALGLQDEWLLTPPLTLNGTVTLTGHTMGSVYWGVDPFDNYDIEAWVIIGGVGGGDDILIGAIDTDYWVVNWQWEAFSYQFTAPGGEFRVGFRYFGSDGAQAGLDLIVVDGDVGPPANDCNDNGVPDDCEGDADGDGLIDGCDDCTDTDGDGLGNPGFPENTCPEDNCPDVSGADQTDTDGDGEGDICDTCTDTDNDGWGDPGFPVNTCGEDNCPAVYNPGQSDADGDGDGDVCDTCTDTDDDGFGDPGFPVNTCPLDGCPDDPNKSDPGTCGCGISDNDDADGDGTPDCVDQCPGVDDDLFAPDCVGAIPTVSVWGLAVLALLLLIAGKLYFGRRSATA